MAFPTSIEAAEYFGVAYNNLSTTLSQVCGISDTTVYVASTDNFPSSGWFTIEDEVRSYTGKTSGSFTGCTPGSDNTVAAEHAAGKQVSLTFPAVMWNRTITEIRAALAKIGADSSAVTSSHDYKLSGITGTDKAASGIAAYAESVILTTIESSATPTPARASKKTELEITALAANAVFGAPTGTPANGDLLLISCTDNGTIRTIGHNAIYTAPYSVSLVTTTIANKTFFELFRYSSERSKWELLFSDVEV